MHRFYRSANDTLELQLVGGELHAPHLRQGQVIDVAGMRASVIEANRDGPTRVSFHFDRRLDDPSTLFLAWRQDHLRRVEASALEATLCLE